MDAIQLKSWRENRKVSRTQLSDFLGVSQKTIEAWEYGYNPIPKWLSLALAAIDFTKNFDLQ